MPYPLENLQYGLRRRLRELTTPAETYALQIAAPHYSGFHPVQKFLQIEHVGIFMDESSNLSMIQKVWPEPDKDLSNMTDYCFRVVEGMVIRKFALTDSPRLILDKFLLAPTVLCFDRCIIDASFLQQFAALVEQPLIRLALENCIIQSETVATYVCDAFRSLRELSLMNDDEPALGVPSRFPILLDALLEMNCTTLVDVGIHSDSMSVLDIDVDKFMKFFKAQRDAVRIFIELTCEINHQVFEEKLNTLFSDKHFKRVSCEAPEDKKRIIVLYAGETYPAYIYYVEKN